jgi:RNA polymerase primary sigma factor
VIDGASARRSPARDPTVPDPLSAYLNRISRVALLTHREEVKLGRRVRAGDRIARRTLIERNLRLVVSVAVRYRRSGVPLEDLIQEGNIGLIEAVERFDPERGYRFSSYAVWRIRKAIQKAAAAQSRTIRVPRATSSAQSWDANPALKSRRTGWVGPSRKCTRRWARPRTPGA